jgi:acetyltransferase-like isoleucine patch superfamily enzyme
VSALRRIVGRSSLGAYRAGSRARAKILSAASAGAFAAFGPRSVLQPPVRIGGERWISIGAGVFIGSGSYLQVLYDADGAGRLEIGDGTSVTGSCVLSAARSVRLGRNVLLARNVYIADHRHAFEDPARPVLAQGVDQVAAVEIGDGAWLGQNVVVGPGVRIGAGAVIGANAVVLDDIPPHAVAVGAPARIVRTFAHPQRSAA